MSRHVRPRVTRIKELEAKAAELKMKEEMEKLKQAIREGRNSPLLRKFLTQVK